MKIADCDVGLKEEFARLTERWRKDTGLSSNARDFFSHPAYLRTIGLGQRVLPLIFAELEREADHWFAALYALTGENVCPGNQEPPPTFEDARQAWLAWGREHGYL